MSAGTGITIVLKTTKKCSGGQDRCLFHAAGSRFYRDFNPNSSNSVWKFAPKVKFVIEIIVWRLQAIRVWNTKNRNILKTSALRSENRSGIVVGHWWRGGANKTPIFYPGSGEWRWCILFSPLPFNPSTWTPEHPPPPLQPPRYNHLMNLSPSPLLRGASLSTLVHQLLPAHVVS